MSNPFARWTLASAVSLLAAPAAFAAPTCADVQAFLAAKATGVVCFRSADLRTNDSQTTPADNSLATFADGTPMPGPTLLGSQRSFTPVPTAE